MTVEGSISFEAAASVLPRRLYLEVQKLDPDKLAWAEELRLRRGYPMTVLLPEGESPVGSDPVNENDLYVTLENASQASAHTVLDKVQQGFVTLKGGHRIGLCGTAAIKDGKITTLRSLSSLSIRIARPIKGQAVALVQRLLEEERLQNTLILAPPGAGKTTLLRELIRVLSEGEAGPPLRVGVADERGEIAALWRGEAQFDVGRRTDVIDGCGKKEGISILLRGMNPQVIAVDEITDSADVSAICEAAGCGVVLLATAHGQSVDDLRRRGVYRELLQTGVFQRIVQLSCRAGQRQTRVEVLPCSG